MMPKALMAHDYNMFPPRSIYPTSKQKKNNKLLLIMSNLNCSLPLLTPRLLPKPTDSDILRRHTVLSGKAHPLSQHSPVSATSLKDPAQKYLSEYPKGTGSRRCLWIIQTDIFPTDNIFHPFCRWGIFSKILNLEFWLIN